MADLGPGPPELIIKRIQNNIKKYEYSISQQELELLELEDRKNRIQINIDATHEALDRELQTLATTVAQYQEEVKNDG